MHTTAEICGRELTLVRGRRYLGGRPFADGRRLFPVFIHDISDGWGGDDPVLVLEAFTYDEANEFLAAFNNGETSFEGRIW